MKSAKLGDDKSGPTLQDELIPYTNECSSNEIENEASLHIKEEHDHVIKEEECLWAEYDGDSSPSIKMEEISRMKEEKDISFIKSEAFLEANSTHEMNLDIPSVQSAMPINIKEEPLSLHDQDDTEDLHNKGDILVNNQESSADSSSSSLMSLCSSLKEKSLKHKCRSEQQIWCPTEKSKTLNPRVPVEGAPNHGVDLNPAPRKEESNYMPCSNSIRKSNLGGNLRLHSGKRPFVCHECNESFPLKSTLKNHMKIHSGERPFICHQCNKSFKRKWSLKTHLNVHSVERPFICLQCNKSFKYQTNLITHMKSHSGERPFICHQCNKSFIRKSTLVLHMKIHSGERPFVCVQCNRSFIRKSALISHMKIHSGERPFVCHQCNASFRWKGNLIIHFNIHSGE